MVQDGSSEADGSFKIDALPGKYVLSASDGKTGKISKSLTLEVREKDITGLEIELISGYEVNGRVAIDGQERIDFSRRHVSKRCCFDTIEREVQEFVTVGPSLRICAVIRLRPSRHSRL
jgi:hypothetical protein